MAKIVGNAFVGFHGKLGNMVGYSWKGVWCVRSRPVSVHNPRTEAQQRHRAMFAEQVRLAGRMSWAVNIGFAAVADEMHITPQNAFVKANQGAFSVDDGGLAVDWNALEVSAGPVAPVALGVPQMDDDGVLTVAFDKNPQHLRANNYDSVHLYVYCPALKTGYLAAPVYRKDRRVSVALPDYMAAHELHLYAFVTDPQGSASSTSHASLPPSPIASEGYTIATESMTTHATPATATAASTSESNTSTTATPGLSAPNENSLDHDPPCRSGNDG